jgi:hypothetical protein
MIAALREPQAPAVDDAEFVRELFALTDAGDLSAIVRLLKERGAGQPRPRNKKRQKESSGPARVVPHDRRDLLLHELGLSAAAESSIERALHAAGVTHDETLTSGALCKWSAADLRELGVEPATVKELGRALAAVRLRLRGER